MRRQLSVLRRVAVVVLCIPAAIAVLATPASAVTTAPASCGRVLFHDTFGRTPDPAWTFFNREGHISDGRLWIDGGYLPNPFGRNGWAFTHVGDRHWRDYSLRVTYNSTNSGGEPAEAHMTMLYVRVSATGTTGYDTAYALFIWDPGQPDPRTGSGTIPHGLIQIMRYVNGNGQMIDEVPFSGTRVGTNHVTVSVVGSKITVWANGHRMLSFSDAQPIRSGGVGVGQIWETNGWFDNVLVRQL